jgi:hypothetical protein
MSQSNNILQELQDLNSNLSTGIPGNIYSVPVGYFDGLIEQVMKRIKASEATSAKEELSYLSPMLNDISRKMPYEVPQDYFETLDTTVHDNAKEELESISPFLSSLKKQMPYEVPQGYFESIGTEKKAVRPAKVVSIASRRWFRYAAAAIIVGVVSLFVMINRNPERKSIAGVEKVIQKEIRKMSDTDINEFLSSVDPVVTNSDKGSVKPNEEIKELLKDVSDAELREFLEETSDTGIETSMMN